MCTVSQRAPGSGLAGVRGLRGLQGLQGLTGLTALSGRTAAGKRAAAAAPSPLAVRRKLFRDSEAEAEAGTEGSATTLEAELTRGLEASASRWEFDFRAGRPMRTARRFEWSPAGAQRPVPPSSPSARQTKITEYLMPRKRAASGETLPPSKIARHSTKGFSAQERQEAQSAGGVPAVGPSEFGRC